MIYVAIIAAVVCVIAYIGLVRTDGAGYLGTLIVSGIIGAVFLFGAGMDRIGKNFVARQAHRRFTIETEGRTFENCRLRNGRYVTADGAEILFGKSLVLIRETTREAIGSSHASQSAPNF